MSYGKCRIFLTTPAVAARIEKLEKEGNIFVLRPEMKPVSRLEKDYDKLMAFYDHGYEMMKRELPRLEAYLEK